MSEASGSYSGKYGQVGSSKSVFEDDARAEERFPIPSWWMFNFNARLKLGITENYLMFPGRNETQMRNLTTELIEISIFKPGAILLMVVKVTNMHINDKSTATRCSRKNTRYFS
jgi:hypothetical protein